MESILKYVAQKFKGFTIFEFQQKCPNEFVSSGGA